MDLAGATRPEHIPPRLQGIDAEPCVKNTNLELHPSGKIYVQQQHTDLSEIVLGEIIVKSPHEGWLDEIGAAFLVQGRALGQLERTSRGSDRRSCKRLFILLFRRLYYLCVLLLVDGAVNDWGWFECGLKQPARIFLHLIIDNRPRR